MFLSKSLLTQSIAILLIESVFSTGTASGNERSIMPAVQDIHGVKSEFYLLSTAISGDEPLTISATFTNASKETIDFRYVTSLAATTWLFDAKKRRIPLRPGASLGEYPAATIRLAPGARQRSTLSGRLKDYYTLPPGKYSIRLIYDLRLIDDRTLRQQYIRRYRSENVVLWDSGWYNFTMK